MAGSMWYHGWRLLRLTTSQRQWKIFCSCFAAMIWVCLDSQLRIEDQKGKPRCLHYFIFSHIVSVQLHSSPLMAVFAVCVRLAQSTPYLSNIATGAVLSGLDEDFADERSEFVPWLWATARISTTKIFGRQHQYYVWIYIIYMYIFTCFV